MPGRALVGALHLDRRARRRDQVDGDVVRRDGQVLAQDLDRVHRRRRRPSCRRPCRASASSAYSRSLKPPPLPIRAPFRLTATDPHRIRSSFGTCSTSITSPCRSAPLIVAASRDLLLGQLGGVEQPERMCVAQARHRHHERLALLEREPPRMGLGRVGIGLDRLRLLPGRVAREPLGGAAGVGEVGDPLAGRRGSGRRPPVPSLPTRSGGSPPSTRTPLFAARWGTRCHPTHAPETSRRARCHGKMPRR